MTYYAEGTPHTSKCLTVPQSHTSILALKREEPYGDFSGVWQSNAKPRSLYFNGDYLDLEYRSISTIWSREALLESTTRSLLLSPITP